MIILNFHSNSSKIFPFDIFGKKLFFIPICHVKAAQDDKFAKHKMELRPPPLLLQF